MNKDLGLLTLRLVFGSFMLFSHGWGKMMKMFAGDFTFADPIGIGMQASLILAVFAEVVCAGLIVLGIKTRLAAIPLLITMLVAAFIVHAADPFMKKEFALMYGAVFLSFIFSGAGKYSLDETVLKK